MLAFACSHSTIVKRWNNSKNFVWRWNAFISHVKSPKFRRRRNMRSKMATYTIWPIAISFQVWHPSNDKSTLAIILTLAITNTKKNDREIVYICDGVGYRRFSLLSLGKLCNMRDDGGDNNMQYSPISSIVFKWFSFRLHSSEVKELTISSQTFLCISFFFLGNCLSVCLQQKLLIVFQFQLKWLLLLASLVPFDSMCFVFIFLSVSNVAIDTDTLDDKIA